MAQPPTTADFSFSIVPRYAEVDQQGVVFNAHYLTWFDEAFTGFLDHVGFSYPDLIGSGLDVHVVHSELDYAKPVRWRDAVRVGVACEQVGATSLTAAFSVMRRSAGDDAVVAVRGRNVYVVVSTSDWGKRPVPDTLRLALTS